jgi:hypothetical protein
MGKGSVEAVEANEGKKERELDRFQIGKKRRMVENNSGSKKQYDIPGTRGQLTCGKGERGRFYDRTGCDRGR